MPFISRVMFFLSADVLSNILVIYLEITQMLELKRLTASLHPLASCSSVSGFGRSMKPWAEQEEGGVTCHAYFMGRLV